MKPITFSIFLFFSLLSIAQKELKDYSLSHSLKQNQEQYQFLVLDRDKKGPWIHKKDRFYFWYKAQKVMATQGGSSGQLLHGDFESFHENKQLSKKGTFRKGLKNGEWLYWRNDGTLIKTETWKKGILRGIEKDYDKSGRVYQTIQHKGKTVQRENADTLLLDKGNGHKQTIQLKDSLGNVYKIEEKKNGSLHGKVQYLENGKVVESEKYKNGEQIVPKEKKSNSKNEEESTDEIKTKKWWQFWKKKSGDSDKPEKVKKEKKTGGGTFKKKNKDSEPENVDSKKKTSVKEKTSKDKKVKKEGSATKKTPSEKNKKEK